MRHGDVRDFSAISALSAVPALIPKSCNMTIQPALPKKIPQPARDFLQNAGLTCADLPRVDKMSAIS
jgi:hypothetical protein